MTAFLEEGLAGKKKWEAIGTSFAKATAKAFGEMAFWPELTALSAPQPPRPARRAAHTPPAKAVDTPSCRATARENDFAIVVGIEDYSNLPDAKFAAISF